MWQGLLAVLPGVRPVMLRGHIAVLSARQSLAGISDLHHSAECHSGCARCGRGRDPLAQRLRQQFAAVAAGVCAHIRPLHDRWVLSGKPRVQAERHPCLGMTG